MPDKSTEPDAPATREEPPANAADADPVLQDLYARLPEGYDLDGHMLLKLRSAGRPRPLCGPVLVRAHARNAEGAGWCA